MMVAWAASGTGAAMPVRVAEKDTISRVDIFFKALPVLLGYESSDLSEWYCALSVTLKMNHAQSVDG